MKRLFVLVVTSSLLAPAAHAAHAARTCADLRLSQVRVESACTEDSCFVEVRAGEWTHQLPFRSQSDGVREEFGYSKACEGLALKDDGGPVHLPPGCEISVNFGGPAGASGAVCVCREDRCDSVPPPRHSIHGE